MSLSSIKYILVGLDLVSSQPQRIIASDVKANLAVVRLDQKSEEFEINFLAHLRGRCGGYELLPELNGSLSSQNITKKAKDIIKDLDTLSVRDQFAKPLNITIKERPDVRSAINQVSALNVRNDLIWFSSFPTRFHQHVSANTAVFALREKLLKIIESRPDAELAYISHAKTAQKSLRVRLPGSTRKSEILIFGGHLDSINHEPSTARHLAPGADDNASGVASLLEALRIVVSQPALERTVEFMFYAGEESGLLGSAEIAKEYSQNKIDVVSVVQLDMTAFPGSSPFVLGSINDYTTPALRDYLVELNRVYIGATIVSDACGYGCSDHASWYRNGYPTLMPFESRKNDMNTAIHTRRDVVSDRLNFDHAAMFSKIAVALALELGDSQQRFK